MHRASEIPLTWNASSCELQRTIGDYKVRGDNLKRAPCFIFVWL